jgi:hypothetical protein
MKKLTLVLLTVLFLQITACGKIATTNAVKQSVVAWTPDQSDKFTADCQSFNSQSTFLDDMSGKYGALGPYFFFCGCVGNQTAKTTSYTPFQSAFQNEFQTACEYSVRYPQN